MSDALPHARRSDPGRAPEALLVAVPFPWLGIIAGCAREDAERRRALVNFTAAESRTLRAVAQALADGDERTRDERATTATHFIDRALDMRFFAEARPVIRAGLADLDARATATGAAPEFAALDQAQRTFVLRQLQESEFMTTTRELVMVACYDEQPAEGARNVA